MKNMAEKTNTQVVYMLNELVMSARYLVNPHGQETDVVLPIEMWHKLMMILQPDLVAQEAQQVLISGNFNETLAYIRQQMKQKQQELDLPTLSEDDVINQLRQIRQELWNEKHHPNHPPIA